MIVAKTNQWAERDKAKDDGDDNLNNQSVGRYAADKDARFGCKGKQKYWFGYKRHVSCDMRRGMITKVAVTPANVTDSQGLRRVLRPGGMALMDKAYSGADAAAVLRAKGCHNGSIKKRNMKGKDRDRDRFLTRLRMPYESVFSKQSNGTAEARMFRLSKPIRVYTRDQNQRLRAAILFLAHNKLRLATAS